MSKEPRDGERVDRNALLLSDSLGRGPRERAVAASVAEGTERGLLLASGVPTIRGVKRFVPATPLGEIVAAHRAQLLAAAERRHAREVRLFGSIARAEDTADSDVDLLVTLGPGARPLDLLSLACDAEDILGVRVDVGTVESLRPEVRQDALDEAVLL